LAQVLSIEGLVKDIIWYHFCCDEDKRKQFVSLILNSNRDDRTFASRINILEKLLDIDYPDLSQRYPKLVN
jgi:Trp operon repressor